jgi:hypothetical protein
MSSLNMMQGFADLQARPKPVNKNKRSRLKGLWKPTQIDESFFNQPTMGSMPGAPCPAPARPAAPLLFGKAELPPVLPIHRISELDTTSATHDPMAMMSAEYPMEAALAEKLLVEYEANFSSVLPGMTPMDMPLDGETPVPIEEFGGNNMLSFLAQNLGIRRERQQSKAIEDLHFLPGFSIPGAPAPEVIPEPQRIAMPPVRVSALLAHHSYQMQQADAMTIQSVQAGCGMHGKKYNSKRRHHGLMKRTPIRNKRKRRRNRNRSKRGKYVRGTPAISRHMEQAIVGTHAISPAEVKTEMF